MAKTKTLFEKELEGKERYVTATFSKKIANQKINDVNPLMPILRIEDVLSAKNKAKKEILDEIETLSSVVLSKETLPEFMQDFSKINLIKLKEAKKIIEEKL